MSFNRTKYDNTAFDLHMGRSIGPGNYRLYGSYAESCSPCISVNGPIGSKSDVSIAKPHSELCFRDMTQVESELSWRNQRLGKTNTTLNPIGKHPIVHKPSCTPNMAPEDTRFTHPLDNFRGMSLTSYQVEPYLHVNPQCHVQESTDRMGMNSRLLSKDSAPSVKPKTTTKGADLPGFNLKK
jgi:hypothetical protein